MPVLLGDCRELINKVPSQGVDLILTDPPYLEKYLYLYEWLGQIAPRVLKPGMYLFCLGGAMFEKEERIGLESGGLKYHWMDVMLHPGGAPRLWSRKIMSGYKPVWVFTNGEPAFQRWRGSVNSEIGIDKKYHKWGQGVGYFQKIIEMYTKLGDVVLDPFSGGGSVPAACKALRRECWSFDIDREAYQTTLKRLESTQEFTLPPPEENNTLF